MNVAVILAGGVGSRLGAGIPKQFVEVLGKPIIAYTLELFQRHREIDAIEIVCVSSHIDRMREIKEEYGLDKVRWINPGGATFQESVMKGIENLSGIVKEDDIAVVHFAVSPFIDDEIISDCIRVAKEKGNAISTTDFVLLSGIKDDETKSSTWIDRDSVAVMSTPHAFRHGYISRLYEKAVETGVIDEVEPHTTTMMYAMGETVYFSKGNQLNIKITRKEDLDLFEGFVLMKQKRGEWSSMS